MTTTMTVTRVHLVHLHCVHSQDEMHVDCDLCRLYTCKIFALCTVWNLHLVFFCIMTSLFASATACLKTDFWIRH